MEAEPTHTETKLGLILIYTYHYNKTPHFVFLAAVVYEYMHPRVHLIVRIHI